MHGNADRFAKNSKQQIKKNYNVFPLKSCLTLASALVQTCSEMKMFTFVVNLFSSQPICGHDYEG